MSEENLYSNFMDDLSVFTDFGEYFRKIDPKMEECWEDYKVNCKGNRTLHPARGIFNDDQSRDMTIALMKKAFQENQRERIKLFLYVMFPKGFRHELIVDLCFDIYKKVVIDKRPGDVNLKSLYMNARRGLLKNNIYFENYDKLRAGQKRVVGRRVRWFLRCILCRMFNEILQSQRDEDFKEQLQYEHDMMDMNVLSEIQEEKKTEFNVQRDVVINILEGGQNQEDFEDVWYRIYDEETAENVVFLRDANNTILLHGVQRVQENVQPGMLPSDQDIY